MVDIENLKEEAKRVVSREDVKYMIGYERGTHGFRVSPSFAHTPEDVDRFIFSPLCVNNLAVYITLEEKLPLPRGVEPDRRKLALLVKGCDSKTVVQLLAEKGTFRENLVIFGVPCTGIVDSKKLEAEFPGVTEPADVEEEGDEFVVHVNGRRHEFSKEELILDKCRTCRYPNPLIYDLLLEEKVEAKEEHYEDVKALEQKSLDEKWEYWQRKFARCIRCYACKEICPLCYCEDCILDRLSPQWIRRSVNLSENAVYHLARAFHLAGRCTGCGECTRACPMGIPLAELNRKLAKDVEELFDYEPGIDPEAKPLLATFRPEDTEDFIL